MCWALYEYREQLNDLLREYMGVPVLPLSALPPEINKEDSTGMEEVGERVVDTEGS